MTTAVIFIILGSALLHAVWNAIIKGGSDKLCETAMKTGGGGLAVIFILPFLPPPDPASWPYLAGTATIHLFYYLFIAYAYKGSDLSYAYTIMRGSSPLFTALVTVFAMQQHLSPGGWAGVGLLSLGILTLALDCVRRGQFNLGATFLALANSVVIMGYTVVDGTGVRLSGNPLSYICWVFLLNTFPILFVTLALRKGEYFRYVQKRWKYGLTGGICSCIAYGLSVWCMTRAPITLVASLRETSVVFGVIIAVIFLKERMTPARMAAVLMVMAGASVMKIFA